VVGVSHCLTVLCASLQARQSSTGSQELESASASGASPTPPRAARGRSLSGPSRSQSENLSKLSAPERAQIALRARRNSMPADMVSGPSLSLTPDSSTSAESGGENIDVGSPPTRTGSSSARSRRHRPADGSSILKQKNKLKGPVAQLPAKVDNVLQPSSSNIDTGRNGCVDPSFYSPIPVSVCTTRVWGAPPPKVFRGPWMSGVNRTSLDALTMEVALPTPPGLDNQTAHGGAGSLIPYATDAGNHDETDMMDVSINSPGLALLGGAFGISPNPRALSATFGADRMLGMTGCGSSVESPMTTVFYSPRLDNGYPH
jgi:hypothetical protein